MDPDAPASGIERWPFSFDADASRFTTVMSWKTDVSLPMIDGVRHGGKNEELSRFIELPRRTRIPMEVAISGAAPLDHLRAHGWHVVSARDKSATMDAYRAYLAQSRGEWSVSKNVYYWLELLWPESDVARARQYLETFQHYVEALGVAEWVAVVLFPDNEYDDPSGREEHYGAASSHDLWARARDGLLLNLANSIPASLRGRFARTALFDIDPGQFQFWARDTDLGVGRHDAYLTIGRNLGALDSPVPLGDVPWQRVWPAVHLPAWPEQAAASRPARYTTVTQWWSDGWTVLAAR